MLNAIARIHVFAFLLVLVQSPLLAAVRGVVVDEKGDPVRGARVALHEPESSRARHTRWMSERPARVPLSGAETSSSGSFALQAAAGEVVDIAVEADGFAPVTLRVLGDEDLGAVLLRPAVEASGRIHSGGAGVSGARVIWASDDGAEIIATTDAEGNYRAPNPAAWASRSVVLHRDHALSSMRVRGGAPKMDVALQPGARRKGRVVAANGAAVADATILVDGLPIARSASDGRFELDRVAEHGVVSAVAEGNVGLLAESTIVLGPGSVVSGFVRDGNGGGRVADAEVRLRNLDSGLLVSSFSSRDGSYAVGLPAPGVWQLEVVAPSWFVAGEILPVGPGESVEKQLAARATSTLIGEVVEADGRAVRGAAVLLDETVPEGADSSRVAWTGPDGSFVVRQIGTEREIALTVVKEGFPRVASKAMQLPPGTRKRGVRIEVDRGVELSGRVVDRGGREITGAFVSATLSDGELESVGEATATAVSGADGAFRIDLPRGAYALQLSAGGYATQTLPEFVVDHGAAPLQVVMSEASTISGVVRRSDGTAVPGVFVTGAAASTSELAITDSSGRFSLQGIPEGSVTLSAMKAEEFINSTRVVRAPSSNVVIEVGGGRAISGRVVDKASGAPVTRFEIELASATATSSSRAAASEPFASDEGTFVIRNAPDGAVQLLVRAEGYAATKSERIALADGKSVADVEIEMEGGGSIHGRVVDASGVAIPGVEIEPMEPIVVNDPLGAILPLVETQSDDTGNFVIPEVAAGVSKVWFRKAGYRTAERSVLVRGNTARLDVQLVPLGEPDGRPSDSKPGSAAAPSCIARVMGRVVGLEPSRLDASTVGVTTGSAGLSAQVDETGSFSIDVPAGSLTLVAELLEPARSRSSRVVSITAACGSSSMVELVFGDVVAGGRVRRDGHAIADAVVSFVPMEDQLAPRGNVRLDSEGVFELPGLAEGAYLAIIRGERRLESYLTIAEIRRGGSVDIDLQGGRVSGRVVSRATGGPVRGAVVSLEYGATSAATLTTLTDAEGTFVFEALPAGGYELAVEHERHGRTRESIALGDRDERALDLKVH